MWRALGILFFVLASSDVYAAVPALCSDAPNQMEGDVCASRKLADANAALNRTYAELRDKLNDLGKRHLEQAEEAWIRFRDLECDLETGNDPAHNGTIMPMLLDECAVSFTEQRTRELHDQLRCPGGDLSCKN